MAYLIEPVTWDIMPDGSIRYYSHGHDITEGYEENKTASAKCWELPIGL